MPKAAHATGLREEFEAKALAIAEELGSVGLEEAAKAAREGCAEALACARSPREHWRRMRTSSAVERLNREVRRSTRAIGAFPDGKGTPTLVTAKARVHRGERARGSRHYLDVVLLDEQPHWTTSHGTVGKCA